MVMTTGTVACCFTPSTLGGYRSCSEFYHRVELPTARGPWENSALCQSPDEGILQVKRYMCVICGFIYDEAKGLPDEGFPPGTKWDDIPLNWTCPECGASKDDFEMVEI